MIELLTLMLLPLLGAINSQNFPDVLSSDEETKYLEAWRNKDFEARNKLIEHNLRLVAHIVKKFENELKSGQISTILFLYLLNRL